MREIVIERRAYTRQMRQRKNIVETFAENLRYRIPRGRVRPVAEASGVAARMVHAYRSAENAAQIRAVEKLAHELKVDAWQLLLPGACTDYPPAQLSRLVEGYLSISDEGRAWLLDRLEQVIDGERGPATRSFDDGKAGSGNTGTSLPTAPRRP